MAGAVRELVTQVTFKVDNTGLGRVDSAIKNLKRNLERLGTGFDTSINNSMNKIRQSITKTSMSIRNLKRQLESLHSTNSSSHSNAGTNTHGGNSGGGVHGGTLHINSSNTRVSGGHVTVTGFHPPSGANGATAHLGSIRNLSVTHAGTVIIHGNVSGQGNPPPGHGGNGGGGNGGNGGGHGGGGGNENGMRARVVNAINYSGDVLAGGAMMTAAVAFPVREAMQFESAMADVRKVVDFDGASEFNEMGRAIQNLSLKIPMAQESLAAIVAAGGQAGIEKENLLDFAQSAAKMGVAFDISADTAGEMMAQWRTAFRMNQSEVVDLADKVNYLGNTTAAAAPKISKVLTYIGPLGEIAGITSGEVAAMGASIVGMGIAPEVAATGVKNLLLALTKGASASDRQFMAMKRLGFDTVEFAQRMQKDGKNAVLDFFRALQKVEDFERASILTDIAGSESISPIASQLSNLENLENNLNKVSDQNRGEWSGSMEGEFAARAATTENAVQLLENSLAVLATSLATAFLPILTSVTQALMPIVQSFSEFAQDNQELVGVILAVVAALGTFLTILGSIGIAVGGIMQLAPMFAGLGGILSGPVLAAILAVGAAIYFVYTHWDELKNYFSSTIPVIEAAVNQLKAAWLALQPAISAIQPILAAIANFIGSVLVGAIMILWNIGVAAFGAIAGAVSAVVSAISGLVGMVQGAISAFAELIGISGRASASAANNAARASSSANYSVSQYNNVNVSSPQAAAAYTSNSLANASRYW